MYPFVTIGSYHIELTGIGIIVCFLTFGIVSYYRCRTTLLPFHKLFYALPGAIALIYGGWSYMDFILRFGTLLPRSFNDLYYIILPENYSFHASGMILGFILFMIIFINQQSGWLMKYKRVDCLFIALMSGIFMMWWFLVLGDDMIGRSTESWLGIYALTPVSEVAKFNKVFPVGIFLSIAALLSLLASAWWKKYTTWPWWGYAWRWTFLFLFGIVLLFQNYPRHIVIMIADIRYDINQYICRIISFLCFVRYLRISAKTRRQMTQRIVPIVNPEKS